MEMLSKKTLSDYIREKTLEHLNSKLYGKISKRRKEQMEKERQSMKKAHDKIQRQED